MRGDRVRLSHTVAHAGVGHLSASLVSGLWSLVLTVGADERVFMGLVISVYILHIFDHVLRLLAALGIHPSARIVEVDFPFLGRCLLS